MDDIKRVTVTVEYLLIIYNGSRALIIREVFSCQEFSVLGVFEENFETRSEICEFVSKIFKMSTKVNLPGLRIKPCELFKQELLAWHEITDLCKEKQGVAITLSMPEDDKEQIGETFLIKLALII